MEEIIMFITTSGRTNPSLIMKAKQLSQAWGIPYLERNKRTIQQIQSELPGDIIVVGKERIEIYFYGNRKPMFFHPNSAMFRIKRIMKGERDPLIDACNLEEGSTFLDCTLGLASDSIVASFIVGNVGKVVGIEKNELIFRLVKEGLLQWKTNMDPIDEAMKRIEVLQGDHLQVLKSLDDNSFDCVYFDPMFEESIDESDGIRSIKAIASRLPLTIEHIKEAKRVARHRVVLKDHYRSERFKVFRFQQLIRKTSKFHYGIIDV